MQLTHSTSIAHAATATPPTTTSGTNPVSSGSSTVSITDFMQLLSTEMSNQDPLQPMDPTQTMTQLAQFTSLQEATQLQQTQSLATGNSYLGSQVTVSTGTGQAPVTGTVTGVDSSGVASGTGPQLILNGSTQEYPLNDIDLVQLPPAATTPTTPTAPTTSGQ
jgi:flagellar basal-body rod modification protein FlgD